jgi:putative copper resistance protein D
MESAFVMVRAVHVAALVALLGGLVFVTCVDTTRPECLASGELRSHRTLLRASAGWLALALASGLGWLGLEAVTMSGLPLARAFADENLRTVLAETWFGQVWMVRGALSLMVAALLLAASRRSAQRQGTPILACTVVAAVLLASLALAGHANSERGIARPIHLAADAVHLLAAGAWLGALLPLVAALARSERSPDGAAAELVSLVVKRFSRLGLIAVGALVATGVINAWFTVATIPGLLTTHYGHVLLVKTALFGCMLVLAAINRTRLTPPLVDESLAQPARAIIVARLRRNAIAELVLGVAILAVVGVLGMTMPAAHSSAMPAAMHMR